MARELSETLARSACYKLLSLAFLPPLAKTAEVFLRLDRIAHALPPGHRALVAPIVQENVFARSGPTEREHGRLFGVGLAATPYESEYDPLAGARKGHRLADLLGFYEAFGVQLSDSLKEFPDHIAVELEFMAILLMKTAHAAAEEMDEARAVSEDAAQKFLADHLAWWGDAFTKRVEAATEDEFYRFSARLLSAFLLAECRLLGADPLTPVASPQESGPLACPFARECPEVSGQA